MPEESVAKPVLTGARVKLRPPVLGDKSDRLRLGRHAEIVRLFGGDTRNLEPLTAEEVDDWYDRIASAPSSWVIEYEGCCIGEARLHSLQEHDQSARYAVGILDPALLDRGLGTEVTGLVLAFAFDVLGLHRVDLRVLSYNSRAIRSYEKSGFRRERIEREAVLVEGQWQDDVIMAILESEWRAVSL